MYGGGVPLRSGPSLGARRRLFSRSGISFASFLDDVSWVFVHPQPRKFCVPEPISWRPLQKINLCNRLGSQPNALRHFLRREFVGPSRFVRVRLVCEGQRWRTKSTFFLIDLSRRCRTD